MASRTQARGKHEEGSESIDELVAELGEKLERLRILYDQYFMGIERREPSILRGKVERGIRTLSQRHIRNTALRFRFNNLKQKLQIYRIHWGRVLRQIEAGAWKGHGGGGRKKMLEEDLPPAMRAARRRRRRRLDRVADRRQARGERVGATGPAGTEVADLYAGDDNGYSVAGPGEDVSFDSEEREPEAIPALPLVGAEEEPPPPIRESKSAPQPQAEARSEAEPGPDVAPALPVVDGTSFDVDTGAALPEKKPVRPAPPPVPRQRAARTPTRPPPIPTGVKRPERRYGAIYRQYIESRKKTGEAATVSYEKLEKILQQQERTLRQHKKWRHVQFRVTEEGGKTVVKVARKKPSQED